MHKTVQKIVYLDSIFLKIVAVPFLPSPPSPESNVVVYSKQSLIPDRFGEATLNRGKGFSSRKGVVLEIDIVLLRRKVDMMGKTFSSSFVRDCTVVAFNYESDHLGESQEVMREWLAALLVARNGELACRLSN